MSQSAGKRIVRALTAALFLLLFGIGTWSASESFGQSNSPRKWHPTRIPAGTNFVGDQVCAECHRRQAETQWQSSMGKAMEPVATSEILTAHPRLTFRVGNFSFEITRRDKQSFYTVSDGKQTISLPILYAFGQGKAGQSYLVEYDGAFYEGRVSFYREIAGLDFTIGQPRTAPGTLAEAVGRRLSKTDTLKCFNCHATGAVSGGQLHLDKLTHGVRCEACHGPGGEHVAANKAGQAGTHLIFNPARLSGDELTQNFCAACHRASEQLSLMREMGVNNVRHQPYRIFKSECYSDDRRISCVGCHNPHEPLRQDMAYYDAKCLACHAASGKTGSAAPSDAHAALPGCRVATKNCASCHMPKVEPPGAHFKFTDHFIRIAKPNDGYQN